MRRRLPWLVALPMMAAGSLAAHLLSLVAVSARAAAESGSEPSERAHAGGAGYLVLLLGLSLAAAVVAAGARLLRLDRRQRRRDLSARWFFLLPPLAFAGQEVAERLFHTEAFPFHAALEPRFLLGLLLQVPFGLLAFLAAWLLLRAVEHLARSLARVPAPRLRAEPGPCAGATFALPRISALAVGRSQRGPPSL